MLASSSLQSAISDFGCASLWWRRLCFVKTESLRHTLDSDELLLGWWSWNWLLHQIQVRIWMVKLI